MPAAIESPRPKDVGILAVETYFPLRVRHLACVYVARVNESVVHL
jgi:hypothetical protein